MQSTCPLTHLCKSPLFSSPLLRQERKAHTNPCRVALTLTSHSPTATEAREALTTPAYSWRMMAGGLLTGPISCWRTAATGRPPAWQRTYTEEGTTSSTAVSKREMLVASALAARQLST